MNVRRWPWPVWIVSLALLTNGVALIGVWWNRLDPPEATLALRVRDVDVLNAGELAAAVDRSRGLQLHLAIRYADQHFRPPGSTTAWLTPEHLKANGIKVGEPTPTNDSSTAIDRWRRAIPIYAVLEVDGLAYQDDLHRQCDDPPSMPDAPPPTPRSAGMRVPARCESLREGSRLYIMDVGTSRQKLRDYYPDRKRYAILAANLHLQSNQDEWMPMGSVHLAQTAIAVDDPWRSRLPELLRRKDDTVHLTVVIGRSLEPWLLDFSSNAIR